jgi:hypothetical protein
MKRIATWFAVSSLIVTSAQALPLLDFDCAVLVGNTSGKGVFNGKDAPYGGGNYAEWAIDQIGDASLDPDSFTKYNTNTPEVTITPTTSYLMFHWGNGQSGDQAYQLFDVTACAPGSYTVPSPSRNGISWIGYLPGDRGGDRSSVPDGGSTALLMGLGLVGLMPLSKRVLRKG